MNLSGWEYALASTYELDDMGRNGWEAYAVTTTRSDETGDYSTVVWMKRPTHSAEVQRFVSERADEIIARFLHQRRKPEVNE